MNVAFAMRGRCPLILRLPTFERTFPFVVQGHNATYAVQQFATREGTPSDPLGIKALVSRRDRVELVGICDGEDRMDLLAIGIDHDCDDSASASLRQQAGRSV
jgi:hypothetical protein